MLYPSIDTLLEKVPSKYMLVTVGAKRARQMKDNEDYQLEEYKAYKVVGKALEEISVGAIQLANENKEN
ncbi:DNA-directed RNA polymerase subunit omega [Caldibacillus thermolactis]|jgi:DNA-directed RNA polymerase subunit omega|uniref:DNA-directed RNA polymerase subunit omega n=1 Tax=Pallidibacillus thermolactis TaxID=251051 RepID=A0ABT2WEA7_9BACI|nr:DNA-directed RNA polymerase subunit omega [Pallidibacillus thermolactis]MCU9593144.1 DNA-directed RNA polymerase subunit omega [Pallidibacillus thermolactis]MCU9600092.1 DNA-directed RNA polymerase subunit omega [Pallidibacillus thermolactis subsp. kokeshiiformis]MED1672171.1 DNA-directed RNA polymerase subunit omega [Pallidibacillus thermolactis subsp. kokeshiiformis]